MRCPRQTPERYGRRVGVEPSTYALRVGSRARDGGPDSHVAARMVALSAGCCWQFMAVRGHVGDTVVTSELSQLWDLDLFVPKPLGLLH
jgi:hypothetical protein